MHRRFLSCPSLRTRGVCHLSLLAALLAWAAPRPAQAAAAKPAAPAGLKVWPASALQRVAADAPPPASVSAGIELVAVRNATVSGQVVLCAAAAFNGPEGKMSDLRAGDGRVIPAAAVRVRYAETGPGFVPLYDEPLAAKTVQPIWVTVKVPADAKPGDYQGTLTLEWADRPVSVPVALTVHGWKLPEPHEWRSWVNVLQSPEAVAGTYKVPLWSDAHFALLEKSLDLMGQLGNDILGVSAVRKGVFGDDPLILFKRVDGKLLPEFKYLERYLDLYVKHAGVPRYLAVNVWNYNQYLRDFGRGAGGKEGDEPDTLPVAELQGDKIVTAETPMYTRPGAEEVWRPVMDGLCTLLKKYGLTEKNILIGTGGDTWPSPPTVAFWKKVAPYAQWRTLTHGQGAPKWSYTDSGRIQPNGMVVGYHEAARRLENNRVKVPNHPVTCNSRDEVGSDPHTYCGLTALLILKNGYDGVCWKGLDYWAYPTASGAKCSPLAYYVGFGNMVGSTPRAICAPGPSGAIATQQFEMFREGLQECEALQALGQGLDVLYPPPVKMCDVTELYLTAGVCRPSRAGGGVSSGDLILTIFHHDGGIGVIPQAGGYNAHKREGQGKLVTTGDALKFDLGITLDQDSSGQDCTGTYAIEITRKGDTYSGTYTGTYRGTPRKGAVNGSFLERAHAFKTGEPPPKSELAVRCEAVTKEMLDWYKLGAAGANPTRELPSRLYATISEVAERIAAKKP